MLGKSKISRFLFAGVVTVLFAAAFLAYSASAGALEGQLQLEGGENPIEFLDPQEPEEPDEDEGLDLPEPQERPERPEPISPVVAPQDPEFACPECGAEYKLMLREVEEPDDGSNNDGNPDNPEDNPLDLPDIEEDLEGDEPEQDEFAIEFPEPEEPEGEPVEMMDIEDGEPVKPAFKCPECDSKYELELLKLEDPGAPQVPEPEDPIEIPEPDEGEEFDIDDLLD